MESLNQQVVMKEATEKDLALLKECMLKTEQSGLSVSLKKIGMANYIEINDYTADKETTNTIGVSEGNVLVDIRFDNKKDFGIKQICAIHRQYKRENTKDFLDGREEALLLSVELGKTIEKKNLYYYIRFFNPMICIAENEQTLHLVVSMENMIFGKAEIDYEKVLNEIEVENAQP